MTWDRGLDEGICSLSRWGWKYEHSICNFTKAENHPDHWESKSIFSNTYAMLYSQKEWYGFLNFHDMHTHTHTLRLGRSWQGLLIWSPQGLYYLTGLSSNMLRRSIKTTCFSIFVFFRSTSIAFHQQGASFRERLRDRKMDESVLRERQGTWPNSDDANKRDLSSGRSVKHLYTHTHSKLNLTLFTKASSFWQVSLKVVLHLDTH